MAAERELRVAQEAYDVAHAQAQLAQAKETEAVNRLNDAQRKFDTVVATVRHSAPRASHWRTLSVSHEAAR